jgi:outer membrane protein assembly factor BamE
MMIKRADFRKLARGMALAMCALSLSACVYRMNIQQGNLLEEDTIDQVEIGMSRSAVEFLLGTPMVADSFHEDRWDYPYYLKLGRSRDILRRWIIVYFEGDQVSRIERDVTLTPSS